MTNVLYKRNAKGKPIYWKIYNSEGTIFVDYGIVGNQGHSQIINTNRNIQDEINSQIKAKRKEGYKALEDIYDNAPKEFTSEINQVRFLNTYLPEFNTHADGKFIPMLCKTLENNKPFEKNQYFGQWKINGERCIISMIKDDGLFGDYHLCYRSREGIDWTSKLNYLDSIIIPCIPKYIKEMMIEEDVALDGELYLPGYTINEINSFIKNTELPQHYKLQYWCYDLCVENLVAYARAETLLFSMGEYIKQIDNINAHLNNTDRFLILPNTPVNNYQEAIEKRDKFIELGFEGLIIRADNAEYQFGGKRNNSMLKFKKILDGKFLILDIIPEGIKRTNLPKFICQNDINDETFICTINLPHSEQEIILKNKDKYISKYLFVEYRERAGVKQVPFHAKGIYIDYNL